MKWYELLIKLHKSNPARLQLALQRAAENIAGFYPSERQHLEWVLKTWDHFLTVYCDDDAYDAQMEDLIESLCGAISDWSPADLQSNAQHIETFLTRQASLRILALGHAWATMYEESIAVKQAARNM